MYCKLSFLFPHISAYSQQQLWIGCSLYSLRVKIAYLDIESKLANHRFVNVLAFENAIQVLNGLAANVHNPAPAVKIIRVRSVTYEPSFLNAINCDWFAWCGLLLWLNYQWCVRVIFVESESQAPRVRVESSKIYSSRSRDLVESSQSRVTRTVESLRVIGLQARVNVESYEISRFFFNIFLLWNGAQHAMKWRPTS